MTGQGVCRDDHASHEYGLAFATAQKGHARSSRPHNHNRRRGRRPTDTTRSHPLFALLLLRAAGRRGAGGRCEGHLTGRAPSSCPARPLACPFPPLLLCQLLSTATAASYDGQVARLRTATTRSAEPTRTVLPVLQCVGLRSPPPRARSGGGLAGMNWQDRQISRRPGPRPAARGLAQLLRCCARRGAPLLGRWGAAAQHRCLRRRASARPRRLPKSLVPNAPAPRLGLRQHDAEGGCMWLWWSWAPTSRRWDPSRRRCYCWATESRQFLGRVGHKAHRVRACMHVCKYVVSTWRLGRILDKGAAGTTQAPTHPRSLRSWQRSQRWRRWRRWRRRRRMRR